ncbi:MAG: MFS transporter, partial [Novosphingobium sp.]|nr:MFS transporter [Novosphingobium sp.]
MNAPATAAQEWRQYWYLPLVAALGYSTAVLSSYGLGPFVEPLQREFGWSRASISFGLTIVGLSGAALSIPIGLLVDRFGPRRLALTGGLLMPAAFALLGTATGSLANWFFLWSVIACANVWIQGTIWVAAVGSRFNASRGLAMALTMSGGSLTSAALPVIATAIIEVSDWRTAFMGVGAIWFVFTYPLIFFFFRGARDAERKADKATKAPPVTISGVSVAEGLRSRQFYQLIAASGFYAFAGIGTIVHFVPVLTDQGATAMGAAEVAALVGIFSLIGRLTTGMLLDRFVARYVGAAVFLLPVVSCALLITDGGSTVSQVIAAIFFG